MKNSLPLLLLLASCAAQPRQTVDYRQQLVAMATDTLPSPQREALDSHLTAWYGRLSDERIDELRTSSNLGKKLAKDAETDVERAYADLLQNPRNAKLAMRFIFLLNGGTVQDLEDAVRERKIAARENTHGLNKEERAELWSAVFSNDKGEFETTDQFNARRPMPEGPVYFEALAGQVYNADTQTMRVSFYALDRRLKFDEATTKTRTRGQTAFGVEFDYDLVEGEYYTIELENTSALDKRWDGWKVHFDLLMPVDKARALGRPRVILGVEFLGRGGRHFDFTRARIDDPVQRRVYRYGASVAITSVAIFDESTEDCLLAWVPGPTH